MDTSLSKEVFFGRVTHALFDMYCMHRLWIRRRTTEARVTHLLAKYGGRASGTNIRLALYGPVQG